MVVAAAAARTPIDAAQAFADGAERTKALRDGELIRRLDASLR